jgi:Mn2+/Fe2+ NRAMP family transporter
VTGHALFPVFDDPQTGKTFWGVTHSALAVVLVLVGGFKRFEKVMAGLLVIMFGSVLAAAALSSPDWGAVLRGLLVPRIPTNVNPDAGKWTLALMGGVGGTVTMLCYGYWIREQGRVGPAFLRTCRIDLGVSYAAIAIFGVSMVLIGRGLHLTEEGATGMMIKLADQLGKTLGVPMRWAFLAGAWAAVFTSMLGVWQAVPYLFCDFWQLLHHPRPRAAEAATPRDAVDTRSWIYRGYLLGLATVPMIGLTMNFARVQRTYSLMGAVVMPLLALALLILNNRVDWIGRAHRNRPLTNIALVAILAFFIYAAYVTFVTGKDVIS